MKVLIIYTLVFFVAVSVKGEGNCPTGWFDCGNDRCVAMIWRCDGDNDCGNWSDEHNCVSNQSRKTKYFFENFTKYYKNTNKVLIFK